jgi:hypothetical protein
MDSFSDQIRAEYMVQPATWILEPIILTTSVSKELGDQE